MIVEFQTLNDMITEAETQISVRLQAARLLSIPRLSLPS
jgi:hypothetical protein